jgi:hypothetical protein
LQVEKVCGLISITISVNKDTQETLDRLSDQELIKLSRDKAKTVIDTDLIRETAVCYQGDDILVMFSL